MMNKQAAKDFGTSVETRSDHLQFSIAGIPSILLKNA
jgi:hypothetical protein